jgi:hypothetical protein
MRLELRAGDAHHEAEVGHQPVVGAQHGGPERVAGPEPPMPTAFQASDGTATQARTMDVGECRDQPCV